MTAPETALPSSAPAFVEADFYCFRCGYNLRTLSLGSICPECSYPVRDSLLIPVDLPWLRHVRRGLTVLCIAGVLLALHALQAITLVLVPFLGVDLAIRLGGLSVVACKVVGAFLATRPPRHALFKNQHSLGWAVRILVLCMPVMILVSLALLHLTPSGPTFWTGPIMVFVEFSWQFTLFGYVLLLLSSLKVRLPTWCIPAAALSVIGLAIHQSCMYYAYFYLIPGGAAVTPAPARTLLIVGITTTVTLLGWALGFTVFHWVCRSCFTQLIARHPANATAPSPLV